MKVSEKYGEEKNLVEIPKSLFCCLLVASLGFVIFSVSTTGSASKSTRSSEETCTERACIELSASVLGAIDDTIDPCDDFFEYACANWIKKSPMPNGKQNWGTLTKRSELTNADVKVMLETPLEKQPEAPYVKEILNMYRACLDMGEINSRGAQPAQDFIKQHFGGWSWTSENTMTAQQLVQTAHSLGSPAILGFGVGIDLADSNNHILSLEQDGLSFMTRDYYISRNGTAFDIMEENTPLNFYFEYMSGVISLLSPETEESFIRERVIKILKFEQELAKIMMSPEEQRDYNANYEEIMMTDLIELTKFEGWDWISFFATFFGEGEVTKNERIVIFARDYLKNVGAIVTKTPIETLKDYAAWVSVKPLISTLSEDFQQLRYKLILEVNGVDFSCQERWRVCTDFVQESMPLVVGRLYVENFFNRNIKTQVENFAESIKSEFIETLSSQTWMDIDTKARAKDKANKMKDKYGFPPYLLNNTKIISEYEGLVLEENDDFWGYTWTINEWAIKNHNMKLRKPVDKELWSMSVQETNAYYSPTENAMVFPAGILQPPLYHIDYPSYFNYGAIGMIIGHEITHGFDDQGRHMDADGNRKNWWGETTSQNFAESAECMVNQYDKQTFMGMNLSGRLTLGENIADNGGVKIAFNAWKRQAKEEKRLPGMEKYSSEQMFFVATAHAWCSESLEKAAQNQMRMDAHPPNKIRVNQAFRNFEPFSEIWQCPVGSPMNPNDRCHIW